MDKKVERMLAWTQGRKPGPIRVDLNPTNRCNLQCRSCWMRGYPRIDYSSQIPAQRLMAVIVEGFSLGVQEWEITGGGEPLMEFETTVGLIRRIKAYEMWGSITTNGTRFTDQLIREMIELGWNKVVFSIDGPDEEINDYLRGLRGAFARQIKALKEFQNLKQRLGKREPIIQFNTVLSRANFEVLDRFVDLAAEVGCELVCFEPITVHSPLGEQLTLTAEDKMRLPESIAKALRRSEATGIWTNARNYLEDRLVSEANSMTTVIATEGSEFLKSHSLVQDSEHRNEPVECEGNSRNTAERSDRDLLLSKQELAYLRLPCYEPFYHLVIKTDGAVGPCCIFNSDRAENIKNTLLQDVWFGPYLQRIRDSLIQGRLQDFCAICNAGQVAENRRIREAMKTVIFRGESL